MHETQQNKPSVESVSSLHRVPPIGQVLLDDEHPVSRSNFRAGAQKKQLLTWAFSSRLFWSESLAFQQLEFDRHAFSKPKRSKNTTKHIRNTAQYVAQLLHIVAPSSTIQSERERDREKLAVTCHDGLLFKSIDSGCLGPGNKTPSHFQWNQWDTFQDLIFLKNFHTRFDNATVSEERFWMTRSAWTDGRVRWWHEKRSWFVLRSIGNTNTTNAKGVYPWGQTLTLKNHTEAFENQPHTDILWHT